MSKKKTLYTISGVLKAIVTAILILLGALVLMLKSVFVDMVEKSEELLNKFAEALKESEGLDGDFIYSAEEIVEYISETLSTFAIVLIVLGLIWLIASILNFIFAKRTGMMESEKKKGVFLMIFCWISGFLSISTILTTIAVFLKPAYSDLAADENLPIYQL